MNVLVRNLPTEVTLLSALLHMLLEEDRASGVCRKRAGSGQENIADAVLYGHFAAQKLSKRRHFRESARGVQVGQ